MKRYNIIKKAVAVDSTSQANMERYASENPLVEYFTTKSESLIGYLVDKSFDLVFIDGDHTYKGVQTDFELVKDKAKIIVFHDIIDTDFPDVVRFYQEIKQQYSSSHDFYEFTDQYLQITGTHLGIGVMISKQIPSVGPVSKLLHIGVISAFPCPENQVNKTLIESCSNIEFIEHRYGAPVIEASCIQSRLQKSNQGQIYNALASKIEDEVLLFISPGVILTNEYFKWIESVYERELNTITHNRENNAPTIISISRKIFEALGGFDELMPYTVKEWHLVDLIQRAATLTGPYETKEIVVQGGLLNYTKLSNDETTYESVIDPNFSRSWSIFHSHHKIFNPNKLHNITPGRLDNIAVLPISIVPGLLGVWQRTWQRLENHGVDYCTFKADGIAYISNIDKNLPSDQKAIYQIVDGKLILIWNFADSAAFDVYPLDNKQLPTTLILEGKNVLYNVTSSLRKI